MSRVRGRPGTLKRLARDLEDVSTRAAQDVASRGAPVITDMAQRAYDSGETVYDEPRPLGVQGNPLDLVEEGDVRGQTRFAAIGTRIWCVLGPKYAKYLIGKYQILPNGELPIAWGRKLADIVDEVLGRNVGGP